MACVGVVGGDAVDHNQDSVCEEQRELYGGNSIRTCKQTRPPTPLPDHVITNTPNQMGLAIHAEIRHLPQLKYPWELCCIHS